MTELLSSLGYHFQDLSLLHLALRHPSMSGENNQRLEFLGDAVLQFLMSDMLYHRYTDIQEGALTRRRSRLVCEGALCQVAQTIGLERYLLLDKSEEAINGRENPSILADAMEAVLAAVYLDGGINAARDVMNRLWPSEGNLVADKKDSKSLLQEYLQARKHPFPTYEITGRSGPDHDPLFTAVAKVDGRECGTGTGRTKQAAQQQAAAAALDSLRKGELL